MFKAGDKVCIPKTKSWGIQLTESTVLKRAKAQGLEYLTVTGSAGNIIIVNTVIPERYNGIGGDYFLRQDLILYKQG